MKIGVSSCLLGVKCTYNGSHNLVLGFKQLYDLGLLLKFVQRFLVDYLHHVTQQKFSQENCYELRHVNMLMLQMSISWVLKKH